MKYNNTAKFMIMDLLPMKLPVENEEYLYAQKAGAAIDAVRYSHEKPPEKEEAVTHSNDKDIIYKRVKITTP